MIDQPVRARLDANGQQVVDIVVNRGYHPGAIVARAGVPLRIVFRRDDQDACSERVVFSSPHFDRRLAMTGATTIELPAQPPGEVRFTCGMGRYRGHIELVAKEAPSILGRLRERASHGPARAGAPLVLSLGLLPLLTVLAVLAVDPTATAAAAVAALIALAAGCRWALRRLPEPT